jgi:hypothetical protein
MEIVNLPHTYFEEQIHNNLVSFLAGNISDYKEEVVLLPKPLSVLLGTILLSQGVAVKGNLRLDSFLSRNPLNEVSAT